jgi:histidinol-phosphate/aromatic aminotransferase/cobyric acid decarboxylase-like protein
MTNRKALIAAFKKGYRIDKKGNLINPEGKTLKGGTKVYYGKQTYRKFNLLLEGSYRTVTFHTLQAYQKFGDKMFKKGIVVRHLNDIKIDNRHSNIAIGTHSDNRNDYYRNKL